MTTHALAQLAYLAAACTAAALMAAALRRHGAVLLHHRRPDLPLPPELHARLVSQGLGLVAQGALAAAVLLQPAAADAAEGLRSVSVMVGTALLALGALHYGTFTHFARSSRARKTLLPLARREPSGCVAALLGLAGSFGVVLLFACLAGGWQGAQDLATFAGWTVAAVAGILLLPGILAGLALSAAGAPAAVVFAGGAVAEIAFWLLVAAAFRARRQSTRFERRIR